MIHPLLQNLFLMMTALSLLLFPTQSTANCNLEKVLISLDAQDKPITEILKDIEKQAKLTIEVQDNQALANKKSIQLNQAPLDLTLNRLLKNISYSTICNNEQKTLSLVLLDKGSHPSSSLTRQKATTSQTNSMEGLSKAMDDYRNNKPSLAGSPQQEPKEMSGLASAMQDYQKNEGNNVNSPIPSNQKTSMDAATDALAQYKANTQNSGNIAPIDNNSTGGMTDLADAMNEYRNLDSSKQPSPSVGKQNSMDGAATAMDEYKKGHNNR
jgi:hypothetical protein